MSPVFRARAAMAAGALAVVAITIWGWQTFWFLTDDAHIEFRYVSNLVSGRGLTFNPAPFRPVEGYTSFSWVLLLAAVWKVFLLEPTQSANLLGLLFGLAELALVAWLAWRIELPASWERARPALLAIVFLGTLTNRTFFTWLSSGLETPLFNFTFIAWVATCIDLRRRGLGTSLWRVSLAATAMTLTRPDGLLAVAATGAFAALLLMLRAQTLRQLLAGLSPMLLVVAHLVFRRLTYDAWLPNTYYAKHMAPWPESGWRYLVSFMLEYGLWVWCALVVWAAVKGPRGLSRRALPTWLAGSTLAAHAAYYCFNVGGDHFEWRVLSHLVPLFWLSAVWLVARVTPSVRTLTVALSLFVAASLPIQWTHWALTHSLMQRGETFKLRAKLAPHFPVIVQPLATAFDEQQEWLIGHSVCTRHQEHKVFYFQVLSEFPPRTEGSKVRWEEQRPIFDYPCIGVAGWVYPNVAIIDTLGLTDFVVARSAGNSADTREMAHDRHPPAGYVACFRPNFDARGTHQATVRAQPLTDEDIVRCEQSFAEALAH